MNIFVDMKIGKRLGLGWGISLALMLLTVTISIIYFNDFLSKVDRIIQVNYAKVEHSVAIRSAFVDIMNNAGIIASSSDRATKEAAMKRIAASRAVYGKALASLEKLEITAEGKAFLAKIKEEVPKRKEVTNRVLELGMSGNTGQAFKEYPLMLAGIANLISISDALIKFNEGRAEMRANEIHETAQFAIYLLLFIGAGNLIFGIIMAQKITKSITFPIMRAGQHIDLMAKGDFSIPVSEHGKKRGDEMGVFARSMAVMNVNLRTILQQVQNNSSKLSTESAMLADSATHLSHGAGEQVKRSDQVAAATTEMNQAAEDIARNASNMTESSHEAVRIGKEGQTVVEKTIQEVNVIASTVETAAEFVKQLGEQSEKIGDIITVIDEIADQTNLLALNAAIEAARAGDAGRGFAVVADEVRKLAERTSASTTEIGNMINSITEGVKSTVASMNTAQEKVTTGVEYSYQAQTALKNILASIDSLSSGINQVATAIEEMSATTDEISRDITEISSVTKETSDASSQIVQDSSDLSTISKELEMAVQKFKI
jgi:methyl-accepting chemotaxis protein